MSAVPNAWWITIGIVGLTLSNWCHTMAFFSVLKATGPIFSALLKAVQTVCVFFLSSLLFCTPERPGPCASWGKSASVLVLVVGLGVYGQATQEQARGEARSAKDGPALAERRQEAAAAGGFDIEAAEGPAGGAAAETPRSSLIRTTNMVRGTGGAIATGTLGG